MNKCQKSSYKYLFKQLLTNIYFMITRLKCIRHTNILINLINELRYLLNNNNNNLKEYHQIKL